MRKDIEIKSLLKKLPNSAFRGSNDKNSEKYIFDNQINTGKEIVIELSKRVDRTNHVLLLARMQSGKTGTCNSVVNIINETKLNLFMGVDRFMFICGMNDCGLKEQTYERLLTQVKDANKNNTYRTKKDKNNKLYNKYYVLKNSDLMKYEGDLNNTVIFVDEAHYGTNENNKITQFFAKHEVDWKNTNDLLEKNIYIVSVSATPFDEIVSDKAICKKLIELKSDDNYFGVSDFLNNNLIHEAHKDDITDGTIFDYIEDAYERMQENNKNGVCIIRTRNFGTIRDNGYIKRYFNVYEMTSSSSNIDYNGLYNIFNKFVEKGGKNIKPLIVLIKGAFRAGITISQAHKEYIYMVYDYSLKAETTAQALLGRMCGYRSNNINNTYFYINRDFAFMYSEWENDFQNRDKIPFNQTKWIWVDENYQGDVKISSKSCGNLSIDLSEDEIKTILGELYHKKNKLKKMESIFPRILRNKGIECEYNYIEEVLMNGKNNYAKSSQTRRFDSFREDLLVYPFRPEKIKKFCEDTNRNYLTTEDIGKVSIALVLDAEITRFPNGEIIIGGNKRLLVYRAKVAPKAKVANRESMYKPHKDTVLV